MTSVPI